MKTLIIEESKWLHGSDGVSTLLDYNGKMCCLGFYGKSCGATDEQLLNVGTPGFTRGVKWHSALVSEVAFNSSLCMALVATNDRQEDSPEDLIEKKNDLTRLFAALDVQVEFIP